jgi:hypothetical protein
MHLTGGRSVYSEANLAAWQASESRPVKVINYLLAGYIDPAVTYEELKEIGIFGVHPPQSIFEIDPSRARKVLTRAGLGFKV